MEDRGPNEDGDMSEDETRLEVAVARLQERQQAAADALTRARVEIDRRLEGMNELREQISQERGRYVDRVLFDSKIEALESRLSALESRLAMINIGESKHRSSEG